MKNSRDVERFFSKVTKTETCWLWTAMKSDGYGRIKIKGKAVSTHRYSWELHHGQIPHGLCVCHKCDVRNCIRPDHLFLGTAAENNRDMDNKNRRVRARGERVNTAVLKESDVVEIISKYKPRITTIAKLAMDYGVSDSCIKSIIYKRNWKHLRSA